MQAAEAQVVDSKEVLSLIYVWLTDQDEGQPMDFGERCARCANEAQQAFLRLDGATEPERA